MERVLAVFSGGAAAPLPPAVVVLLGAIPGAWVRYAVVSRGFGELRSRPWSTWGINMAACFLMGLLMGLPLGWGKGLHGSLSLGLAVGFLGSLSTYSTLLAELVASWRRREKKQAIALAVASILGGLLICLLGMALGQSRP